MLMSSENTGDLANSMRGDRRCSVCAWGLHAMVEHAGGELTLLPEPAHGKPGRIVRLPGSAWLLDGLPPQFVAARYHSLRTVPGQVKGGSGGDRGDPGRRGDGD
jgi:anthranilate/para-aminobenzoate synthase component II